MQLQAGDVLACYGGDLLGRFISSWTWRPWYRDRRLRVPPSHVAMVVPLVLPGRLQPQLTWFESTSLCATPCLVQGRGVSGVQAHLPAERILDYRNSGGRTDVYRLTPGCELQDPEWALLNEVCLGLLQRGVRYDTFGAIGAGFQLTKRWLLLQADLEDLYCSEVVHRLLMRLNRTNWSNPSRTTPGDLIRRIVCDGVYSFAGTV